ncbi:MAG: hypothetical protein HQL95_12940 [Magnetococcales bacterium]|nr:hypothetical protein [Magnetococcales bacterium]
MKRSCLLALLLLAGCGESTPNTIQGYVEGEYLHLGPSSALGSDYS